MKYKLSDINKLNIPIKIPRIIFLKGDLGAGKTTLAKHIFNNLLGIKGDIKSPTYIYYNKYGSNYHFDLYRLKDYEEFFAIGGEEILDNNEGLIIIEWPELIENNYRADIVINIEKTGVEGEREISIIE